MLKQAKKDSTLLYQLWLVTCLLNIEKDTVVKDEVNHFFAVGVIIVKYVCKKQWVCWVVILVLLKRSKEFLVHHC